MSGKNLVLELKPEKLSANQIARFFNFEYLKNRLTVWDVFLYDDIIPCGEYTDRVTLFWFSQNLGKSAKNGPKMWFFLFLSKSCPLMCIFLCLKSCSIMFFTILRNPHVQEKSGSPIKAQKALGQSDCSIFQL